MKQNPIKGNKPFVKGDPRCNREGRPRKFISTVLIDLKAKGYNGLKKQQIVDTYTTLIELSELELETLSKDITQPALVSIVANAILGKQGFETIEKMLDRAFGKALETIETVGEPTHIILNSQDVKNGGVSERDTKITDTHKIGETTRKKASKPRDTSKRG